MRTLRHIVIASAILAALPAHAQIASFKHIVVIVQENRTPDNLFHELCNQPPAVCNPTSTNNEYDIKTDNWKTLNHGTVHPVAVDLGIGWDIFHGHQEDWVPMCDAPTPGEPCQMDGAVNEKCDGDNDPGGCNTNRGKPEFTYVQRYTNGADVLGPYITLALTYGWANLMFESNQGPSFEAHQFI